MGLTVNRQMALKLTVNRQKRNIFLIFLRAKISRQTSQGQLMPLIIDRFNISQKCIFVLVSLE